ncbi:putative DnaJ subfamily C member 7 [Paratrimastix pyriformis]|uniref:DnaJ subfamily C member 7 n=1 Tax=Paratrimastix pyriformis TaxID=342808 RepID=A0ABQ8UT24_9EUKA|nr:putative DnaJ subfamily C member 7 [Paratrimastix pyriformis]
MEVEREEAKPGEVDALQEAERCKEAGNQAYKAKLYHDALVHYTRAIELNPQQVSYYGNRSAVFFMLKDFEKCVADCQAALKLDHNYDKATIRLARCYLALGDFQRTRITLATAPPSAPRAEVTDVIAQVTAAERRVASAQRALDESSFEVALSLFNQGSVVWREWRGMERRGAALETSPRSQALLLGVGKAQLGAKKFPEAASTGTKLLQRDHSNIEAYLLRARALFYDGDAEAAKTLLTAGMRVDPDNTACRLEVNKFRSMVSLKEEGNAHFQAGRFQAAFDTYSRALAIDPLAVQINGQLYCNRALMASKLGRHEQAVADSNSALESRPDWDKAIMRRAAAYMALQKYEEAARDYDKLTKLHPEEREYRRQLHEAQQAHKVASRKDYYKILGVERNADEDTIRKAYRKLALKFHPDKNSATEEQRKEATRRFQEIGEAFDVLNNPQKRARFDSGVDMDEMGGGEGPAGGGMFFGGGGMGGMGGMPFGMGGFGGGMEEEEDEPPPQFRRGGGFGGMGETPPDGFFLLPPMSQTSPFDRLPDELISLIFSNLTRSSLSCIKKVSRRFLFVGLLTHPKGCHVNIAVLGGTDAGKSNIIGHLLTLFGVADPPKGTSFAPVTDRLLEERVSGRTLRGGHSQRIDLDDGGSLCLIDLPGHPKYTQNMLRWLSCADVHVLVVPASAGELEAATAEKGPILAHSLLSYATNIHHQLAVRTGRAPPLIVAVTKMDHPPADQRQSRFADAQEQTGAALRWLHPAPLSHGELSPDTIPIIPVSGVSGENLLVNRATLCPWASALGRPGPLLRARQGAVDAPLMDRLRFQVMDVRHSPRAITGIVRAGEMRLNQVIRLVGLRATYETALALLGSAKTFPAPSSRGWEVHGINPENCTATLCLNHPPAPATPPAAPESLVASRNRQARDPAAPAACGPMHVHLGQVSMVDALRGEQAGKAYVALEARGWVSSMQIDHKSVTEAFEGNFVGIQLSNVQFRMAGCVEACDHPMPPPHPRSGLPQLTAHRVWFTQWSPRLGPALYDRALYTIVPGTVAGAEQDATLGSLMPANHGRWHSVLRPGPGMTPGMDCTSLIAEVLVRHLGTAGDPEGIDSCNHTNTVDHNSMDQLLHTHPLQPAPSAGPKCWSCSSRSRAERPAPSPAPMSAAARALAAILPPPSGHEHDLETQWRQDAFLELCTQSTHERYDMAQWYPKPAAIMPGERGVVRFQINEPLFVDLYRSYVGVGATTSGSVNPGVGAVQAPSRVAVSSPFGLTQSMVVPSKHRIFLEFEKEHPLDPRTLWEERGTARLSEISRGGVDCGPAKSFKSLAPPTGVTMALQFTYHAKTHIILGPDTVKQIGGLIKKDGIQKVLLTAGEGSIRRNGVYDQVAASLRVADIIHVDFFGIPPNPTLAKVHEAVQICKSQGIQAILAVGGGSTNDASKAIASGAVMDGDVWDCYLGAVPAPENALPLYTVLTMSGTSSEYNAGSVVTNAATKEKRGTFLACVPRAAIIDPTLQVTLPWRQTAAGSIDTISHLLEQYMGADPQAADTTLNLNVALIKSVITNCTALQAHPEVYTPRANLCWAASLGANGIAGLGLSQDWNVHWLEHVLSGYLPRVTHGEGLAILTPPYMRWIARHVPAARPSMERLARDLYGCGVDEAIDRLQAQFRAWGAPSRLSEVGLAEGDIAALVALYGTLGCRSAVHNLTPPEVEAIYRAAL